MCERRLLQFPSRRPSAWTPAPKPQTQTDGRKPSKASCLRGESPSGIEGRQACKISSEESVRIRRVIIGILPFVKITKQNRDANSATNVCSHMLRLTASPVKSRRKKLTRISCFTGRVHTSGLRVPRLPSEKVYSTESWTIGSESLRHALQGHMTPHKNSGKKESIARSNAKV